MIAAIYAQWFESARHHGSTQTEGERAMIAREEKPRELVDRLG
jgi:hypothetical protein